MSSPAERAHHKCLTSPLVKVRTITASRQEPIDGQGGRTRTDTQALHERIQALIAKGKGNLEIAAELGVTPQTIGRHRKGQVKSVK